MKRLKKWNRCVSTARLLIGQYGDIRFKVAELALKCCNLENHENRYSLKQFADEIGMKHTTLVDWIRLKKNIYDRLPEQTRKSFDYGAIKNIDRALSGVDRNDKAFPKILTSTVSKFKQKSGSTLKMEKYLRILKSIRYNAENPDLLKKCDAAILVDVIYECRSIASLLSKTQRAAG